MMGFTVDPNQIKEILLERDRNVVGGVDVVMVGKPGCGKTTGLCKFAIENRKRYNDVIIWRAGMDCQWSLLLNSKPKEKLVLWLKDTIADKYKIIDRKNERETDPKKYFYKIRTYSTARELVNKLEKDKINVVQSTPFSAIDPQQHIKFCREWMEIFSELNRRMWKNSVSVLFDELEDLVPEAKGKLFWDVELSLSSIIRSLRKNYISSFFACHSLEEVHWRIRKKIRWKIYMKGSKPEPGTRLTINTNKLRVGEAWIEGEQIEKFKFSSLGKEHLLRAIIDD